MDDGAHEFYAATFFCLDANNCQESAPSDTVTITVDAHPSISSPASGQTFNTHSLTVTGTGPPNEQITLYDSNHVPIPNAVTFVATDGSWSIPISLQDGTHDLSATSEVCLAANDCIESGPSSTVSITIDNKATITSPQNGATITSHGLTVLGTAPPNEEVTIVPRWSIDLFYEFRCWRLMDCTYFRIDILG